MGSHTASPARVPSFQATARASSPILTSSGAGPCPSECCQSPGPNRWRDLLYQIQCAARGLYRPLRDSAGQRCQARFLQVAGQRGVPAPPPRAAHSTSPSPLQESSQQGHLSPARAPADSGRCPIRLSPGLAGPQALRSQQLKWLCGRDEQGSHCPWTWEHLPGCWRWTIRSGQRSLSCLGLGIARGCNSLSLGAQLWGGGSPRARILVPPY